MPLPSLKNEFQICAFPLFHLASCWLFHSTWGIFARVSRAVAVGVFICNYQEARLGNIFFPFRFPSFCYLLQAKRGGALKKALNLQQVAIAHVARPFFAEIQRTNCI